MEKNLIHKFTQISGSYPKKQAIQYKQQNSWAGISYSELSGKIRSLSVFLSRDGVEKGDNIAIMLKNSPKWPISFFAVISAGAVPIPINPDASSREIENILKDSNSKIIFADKESSAMAKGMQSGNGFIKKVINADSDMFSEIIESQNKPESGRQISETDLACILYTSGTTGTPKGVMLSHKNLLANCNSLNKLNIIRENDSVVSILPLHHAYPLTITMLLPLLYGAKIVYPESIKSEDISEAMRKANPTVFVGVPQFFHAFHKKVSDGLRRIPFPFNMAFKLIIEITYFIRKVTGINMTRVILRGLHKKFGNRMRLFASGGAKLNEKAAKDLLKLGFTISEGYGLSETSPVLTFNPPDRPKIGSAGIPIPDVKLKIANPNDKGIGEVIARGPNIMEGYYKRPDLTKDVVKNGWFYTGDLGFFDKDGYLFLTGRSKDIIVLSSGLNLYPEEIEEAYTKDVPIKEICVFEAPSPKGVKSDFVLWAVVRPDLDFFKKYGEINLRHVIKERLDNASKTLPAHNRIMGFSVTLQELPRTALGKLKRFEIKDLYASKIAEGEGALDKRKQPSEGDRRILESENAKKIITQIKKQFDIKGDISIDDSLEIDLGIDSLGRIELASGMESLFGVKIKDEIIGRSFTVKDLIIELEGFLKSADKISASIEKNEQGAENYWKKLFNILPEKENLDKLDLSPGIFAWIGGFLFLLPFYIFFKFFYRLKVEGKENVSDIKRHILYVNHTSYFDGLLVGASLPRFPKLDMFFIGFRPYFNVMIIRNLIKIGRIIPLDFASHLTEALRSCYYVLDNEKNLCIFPEGMRTLDGNVGEFKKGFGILAKESNAKLVPVVLEGVYEAWPRTSKFPKRHPIKVRFGRALDIEGLEKKGLQEGASDGYHAICIAARQALIEMKERK
jgi:long-chain acyl-CoA synthetase